MGLINNHAQDYYNSNDFGNYQFTSLKNIINQFMLVYVGQDKIIPQAKRMDVAFHAQRALAELSFDTLKSCKAQEITVPSSLQMILPQDYVNYTKISWVDSAGIKHLMYPASKTSNPIKYQADSNNEYLFTDDGHKISSGEMVRNGGFHGIQQEGKNTWRLNFTLGSSQAAFGPNSALNPFSVSTAPATEGDPVQGWFAEGNTIRGYDVAFNGGFIQDDVYIKSGESYNVTFTLSGYTSGEYALYIIDENGDKSQTTWATANGTYSEVLVAGSQSQNSYRPNYIMFIQAKGGVLGNVTVDNISVVRVGDEESSVTWSNYKSHTPSENQDDYQDDTYWPMDGSRYGLDPQHAQANGSFYIDCVSGKIHFSSNISGKTVILDYISDSLGTDGEMQVHKFAEEAMYKWISHAIMAGRANVPEYQVNRFKKERFAAIRTAKLRLSNLKLEELTQILRGKSKQIKH